MVTQNSIMNLLVGKDVARTASATALDLNASTYLADGEIAVVDISGTVLNTTTVLTANQIRIVQSQGILLPSIQSPIIELAGLKSYKSKAYTAAVAQVDYIGYNVSTNAGAIEVINSNGYEVMIHDLNSAAYGSNGVSKFGFYVSDSAATQAEIFDGIALNLYQNTTRVVRKPFIVERVASVIAGTDTTGAMGTITFTKDSNIITPSVAGAVTALANGIAVGAYIKLVGTAATDAGTIYKITALDGTANTITLDIPYQGVSGTSVAGQAVVYTAALLNGGSLGIKLSGIAPVFVGPMSTESYVNRWSTNLRNFGTTTATNVTLASEGSGTYILMACLEAFVVGNEGFNSRNDIPYISPRACVLAAGTYHILSLEWDSVKSGGLFNQQANSKQLLMAFNFVAASAPTSVLGSVTAVQDVLNVWINSAIGVGTLA